jgi:hypothetical protein
MNSFHCGTCNSIELGLCTGGEVFAFCRACGRQEPGQGMTDALQRLNLPPITPSAIAGGDASRVPPAGNGSR